VFKDRGAVGVAVFLVELVGKLVKDHIAAVR
jgi:hypothetical protein